MLPREPVIQVRRFNWESYRADMNALLAVAHTLHGLAMQALQYAAAVRRRDEDYHLLLAESNEMLHAWQNWRDWQREEERLYVIIAELDRQLREYEERDEQTR